MVDIVPFKGLLFNQKKTKLNLEGQFGKLSLINRTLQSCYLGQPNTETLFDELTNFNDEGDSRYLFFYANYLIGQNNFSKAKNIFKNVHPLNSTLLISQAKKWIDEGNYNHIEKFKRCRWRISFYNFKPIFRTRNRKV